MYPPNLNIREDVDIFICPDNTAIKIAAGSGLVQSAYKRTSDGYWSSVERLGYIDDDFKFVSYISENENGDVSNEEINKLKKDINNLENGIKNMQESIIVYSSDINIVSRLKESIKNNEREIIEKQKDLDDLINRTNKLKPWLEKINQCKNSGGQNIDQFYSS